MEMQWRLPMSVQTDSCLRLAKFNESNGLNFVFSPFSMYLALSVVACGSNGRTLQQMLSFCKANSLDHLNSVASRLIDSVNGSSINGGPYLTFINGVWVERSLNLKPSFKEIVNIIYRAEAEAVDFRNKDNEVLEKVNTWAEKETNGLIQALLPPDSITKETRLVISNALYFKGTWNQEFNRSKTKHSEFYLLDGNSVQVPFMTSKENQFISFFDGFKVLQLPYKQGLDDPRRFSMYIFLPNERNGLHNVVDKVTYDPGFLDKHLPIQRVEVRNFRIPKFKISFGFEASSALKDIGLVLPFDRYEAELTEMVMALYDGGRLYVSGAYHKCFVEVDEEGTEATAATAVVVMQQQCLSILAPIDFVANHPFMFIIRDDISGAVMFMGHVLNPLLMDG